MSGPGRPRGLWELSTERLGDLHAALGRIAGGGDAICTEIRLQHAGFDGPAVSALRDLPARHAAAMVEAVLGERLHRARPGLELVWTGPEPAHTTTRDTSQVVAELFAAAEHRVLIAGFAFWNARDIFEPLHQRALAQRALAIDFFIHVDPSGRSPQMTLDAFWKYSWPWPDVRPTVYCDTRADDPAADRTSMHAKCVVVDETATLITSANFTSAAQTTNIELGVLVRDAAFAHHTTAQWRGLVAAGMFRKV